MRKLIFGLVGLLALCSAAGSQPFGHVIGPSGGCVLVTGSGGCVGQTSPTLITPVLGVATGTSLALSGTLAAGGAAVTANVSSPDGLFGSSGSSTSVQLNYYNGGVSIGSAGPLAWTSGSVSTTRDLFLSRAGAASLQFGPVDVDTGPVAQTTRTQGALAGGTSNVAGANWTFIASPGKGTGAGGSFIFQTTPAGSSGTVVGTPTTALTIDSTQKATFAGNVQAAIIGPANGGQVRFWGTGTAMQNPSDGVITFTNNAGTSFGRLQLGGTTSSFPSIKLNSTAINFRLADDSADAPITAAGITTSGQIVAASMTQTSAAQSGTVCFAAAGLTYDASLGCLASLEELKNIRPGGMPDALDDIRKLKPFWFNWKSTTPEWQGGNHETLPGLGAHATEAVDKRLVGYGPDGKLRGVHYPEMVALLVAGMQQQQKQIDGLRAANDNLARRVAVLERRR